MRKKIRNVLSLVVLGSSLILLAGCNTLGGEANPNGSFWKRNINGKFHVLKRDATAFYQTWDRHMWNHDWDDPALD